MDYLLPSAMPNAEYQLIARPVFPSLDRFSRAVWIRPGSEWILRLLTIMPIAQWSLIDDGKITNALLERGDVSAS
jgi:hypothetical protein